MATSDTERFLPPHGGDTAALAAFAGRDRILDFSVNVRPDGAPDYLRSAMLRALNDVSLYPDPRGESARAACAQRLDLPVESLVFGNGTSELFVALAHTLKERGCPCAVLVEPTFGDYALACETARLPLRRLHARVVKTSRRYARGCSRTLLDWRLPQEEMTDRNLVPENAALFLPNPGNPAGTWLSPDVLAALCRTRPDVTFVVDEAFATYAGRDSLVSLLPALARALARSQEAAPEKTAGTGHTGPVGDAGDNGRTGRDGRVEGDESPGYGVGYAGDADAGCDGCAGDSTRTAPAEGPRRAELPQNPRLVVVRSLTKFHGLAGLRVGYLAAAPDMAGAIEAHLPSWNCNNLALACARAIHDRENRAAALSDEKETRARNRAARRHLLEILAPLPLTPFRSAANYLLLRLDTPSPRLAEEMLKEEGVALRDCATYEGLEDGRWFRVAVRTKDDHERLAEALARHLPSSATSSRASSPTPSEAASEPSSPTSSTASVGRPAGRRRPPALMVQGTTSGAGKSLLCAALCRILARRGYDVAPFKAQNMSLNSGVTEDGLEMGRAQILQARACGLRPDARMNPVLLKPLSDRGSQVVLLGKPHATLKARDYLTARSHLAARVREAYESLAGEHEIMILEGAGSPGEVNLKRTDLANMNAARMAGARVLLAGDIDRGGLYASFLGHWLTFSAEERDLVAGFVVNRFRGDPSLLSPAHDWLFRATGRPVLGVVPFLKDLVLPEEDGLDAELSLTKEAGGSPGSGRTGGSGGRTGQAGPIESGGSGGSGGQFGQFGQDWTGSPRDGRGHSDPLDVALIVPGHMANFTDLDALKAEPDVTLRPVHGAEDFGHPDLVILPGSRSVVADLAVLNERGITRALREHVKKGGHVVGVCGGLQMLGTGILDPLHVESDRDSFEGMGLLPIVTTLAQDKTLRARVRVATPYGPCSGYEIHHGTTRLTRPGNPTRLERSSASGDFSLRLFEPLPENAAEAEATVRAADATGWATNGAAIRTTDGAAGEAMDPAADKAQRPDPEHLVGLVCGRVLATYLHGLFDDDAFRRAYLDSVRVDLGKRPVGRTGQSASALLERSLDRLADAVEEALDVDLLLKLAGVDIRPASGGRA